ncbi:MAG TPA: hypothetical protein VEC06_10330 [Paucimonas sp.]|nr:hypothetical protein [Paucimonas sp.]
MADSNRGGKKPWIPSGVTGTASVRATPDSRSMKSSQSRTHNYVAQSTSELHESRVHKIGSLQTTFYNTKTPPGQYTSVRAKNGVPELVRPQTKSGRIYVSLDSPGMGSGVDDKRMNRAQVGAQYRESYRQQQITKKQSDFIPATYHAEVSLPQVKRVSGSLAPQSGGGLKKAERNKRDQVADVEKYRHGAGILPASFDALKAATKPGSERLAVASRAHRQELKKTFLPSTIVHPSELLTRTEQMEARVGARKAQAKQDRLAVNPKFSRQAHNPAKK